MPLFYFETVMISSRRPGASQLWHLEPKNEIMSIIVLAECKPMIETLRKMSNSKEDCT